MQRGHSFYDLAHTYTVDQVYLFYEKAKKIELDEHKMRAIILGKSLYCMSPSYAKKDASKKSREWTEFINKLDYDYLTKPKDITKMFQAAGIPIIDPKKLKKKKKGAEK